MTETTKAKSHNGIANGDLTYLPGSIQGRVLPARVINSG